MPAKVAVQPLDALPDRLYYLKNFQRLLAWIEDHYSDLLLESQSRFIETFGTLPTTSQALLTRMAMRKSDLFRAGKLHYEEIGPLRPALAPLIAAGLVEDSPTLDSDELFALLTKAELLTMFELPRGAAQLPKSQLLELLRPGAGRPKRLAEWGAAADEHVYRLCAANVCERFRLMYFGNFHQTWSEFVLVDLGVFRYETVQCTMQSRAFQSAQQIEVFHQIYRCRERLHAGSPPAEVLRALPGVVEGNGWIEQRRQKLLYRIAQRFESVQEPSAALALYSHCEHPGSLLRAALILERSGDTPGCRDACLRSLSRPQETAFHPRMQRVLQRLERKLGGTRLPRPARRLGPSAPTLFLPATTTSVEVAAAAYLSAAQPDSNVFNVENSLISSLFGLLCWDAVFAPVPGAFFHPFHRGPVDLLAADFHERRRTAFDACFAALDADQHQDIMRRRFQQKHGIQSPFVFWGALSQELLDLALLCIPGAHLHLWFEWILRDVSANSAGFPDLVQFWPAQRRYRMIEIKGPGDRLQENQRRLLDYCTASGLPMLVSHVRWDDAPRLA